jgi:hypothetical protein
MWDTVTAARHSYRRPIYLRTGLAPAPTAGSSIAERGLIIRSDQSVLPRNKMRQEIASAINSVHFHQNTPAHVQIMYTQTHPTRAVMTVTNQDTTATMALIIHIGIITVEHTVDEGVIDFVEHESA